jgi:hypothetical protein
MQKSRALASTILAVLGGLACAASTHAQSRDSFPGKKSVSKSPNGELRIRNLDGDKPDSPHHLELEDARTAVRVKLLDYDHNVDVLWSSKGDKFVVIDHAGTNLTETYLFIVDKTVHRINMTDELQQKMPETRHFFQNDHVFVEALAWKKNDTIIKIKLFGQGVADPNGFTEFFEYTLGGDFKKVSK